MFHRFTVVAFLLCLFTGCGDTPTGLPVHGHVTYQDQPVAGGTLTFYPASGRSVSTVVSAAGDYNCQLDTGNYRVTLLLGVTLPTGWKEGDPVPRLKTNLPRQYTSRVNTPLTANVTPGMNKAINFSLE